MVLLIKNISKKNLLGLVGRSCTLEDCRCVRRHASGKVRRKAFLTSYLFSAGYLSCNVGCKNTVNFADGKSEECSTIKIS